VDNKGSPEVVCGFAPSSGLGKVKEKTKIGGKKIFVSLASRPHHRSWNFDVKIE
jgi:hypothetical protein